jgi:outer membrane protein OmpU
MRKIFLATTVLAATTGLAAADVTLSGDARMGLTKAATANSDAQFSSRARVTFTASGETDSGLSFGASFRADNAATGAVNGSAGNVFIEGAFGKLSMGDVDSAAEAAVGQVAAISFAGLGDTNEINYIGAGAAANDPVVLYTYSVDAFKVFLSANDSSAAATQSFGIGASYSIDSYGISVGYEDGGADTKGYIGLSGTFGPVSAKLVAADQSSTVADRDGREYALSLTYAADMVAVTGFYNVDDRPAVALKKYGVGASYDLGGGAKIVAGIAGDSAAGNDTAYDLGLTFSF